MIGPVFVLHGIANRDPADLDRRVATLRLLTGHADVHPVYWGDLGAADRWLADVVPGAPATAGQQTRGTPSGSSPVTDQPPALAALATALVTALPSAEDGSSADGKLDDAVRRELIREAAGAAAGGSTRLADRVRWASDREWDAGGLRWLYQVDDPQLLREIGTAVGCAVRDTAVTDVGVAVRGDEVRTIVGAMLRGMDRVAGATLAAAAERFNTSVRMSWSRGVAHNLGDVLVYQHRREEIHARVHETITTRYPGLGGDRTRRVHLVGHSLGGTIALDLATDPDRPLWTASVVTFGCQWPLFHLWHPRNGLSPYRGDPVPLPESLDRWRNLYEPLDPLAFAAATVFRLHSGRPPDDVRIEHSPQAGLFTHSAYWQSPQLIAQLARAWRPV